VDRYDPWRSRISSAPLRKRSALHRIRDTSTDGYASFRQDRSPRSSRWQRRARQQRVLRRRAGTVSIERAAPEIRQRRDQRRLILGVTAQSEIALAAEQAAHFPRRMAMVDAQRLLRRLAADRAHATLSRQQRGVIRA
jgi:hypothetical protein